MRVSRCRNSDERNRRLRVVEDVVERLVAALEPDYVIIGGGNADKIGTLPKTCHLGKNANAFLGGFRLWEDAGLSKIGKKRKKRPARAK